MFVFSTLAYSLSIRSAFNDFFPGTVDMLMESQSISRPNVNNSHIVKSTFINIHCGSAIWFSTGGDNKLLVEECMFYNCTSYNNGGAIHFFSMNGRLAISKVCGHHCFTENSNGQFIYQYKLSAIIHQLSIHRCPGPYQMSTLNSPIYSLDGFDNFSFCNVSYCQTNAYCIYYGQQLSQFLLSYCTIADNIAASNSGIRLYLISVSNIMNTNLINNYLSNGPLISTDRPTYISGCIFLFNHCPLFGVYSTSTFSLTRCFINHVNGFSYSIGSYAPLMTTIGYTQTLVINHYSTYYCNQLIPEHNTTPCPTFPAPPSTCLSNTEYNSGFLHSLSSIINIISCILLFPH